MENWQIDFYGALDKFVDYVAENNVQLKTWLSHPEFSYLDDIVESLIPGHFTREQLNIGARIAREEEMAGAEHLIVTSVLLALEYQEIWI